MSENRQTKVFSGKENHYVTLAEAAELTKNHRESMREGDAKGAFFGSGIYRKILAQSKFGELKDRLVERTELPGKAAFGPVHLEGRRDAQESGIAYVYFFAGGQAQKAWIPVVDGKNLFTVITEPFTGRTRVVAGKVEVTE